MNRISYLAFSFAVACGLVLMTVLSIFFLYHFREMLGDREPPPLTYYTTHSAWALVIGLILYMGYTIYVAIRVKISVEHVLLHASISFFALHFLMLVYGISFTLPYVKIVTSLVH